MTVAIFGREFNAANSDKLLTLLRSVGEKGVRIIYYSSFLSVLPGSLRELIPSGERFDACSDLSSDCKLFFALGGDGTFLSALTLVRGSGIPVVGVNFGRLGFLTTSTVSDTDSNGWISELVDGKYRLERRTVLSMHCDNMFNKGAWRPVPLGDGQTLSLRFQTNGTYYTALTASFVEPWLTGVKPISLNISLYYTKQTNSYTSYYYTVLNDDEYMEIYGASIGIGKRLEWPDNYFVLYNSLGWQSYSLKDWNYNFIFSTGVSHNISYTFNLTRDNTDQQLYPRSGSSFSFSLQLTPPYSLFRSKDTDWSSMTDQEHYNWIEYHKWTFKGSLFTKIVGDLVLMTRAQFGYLGYYNRKWGYSPFEGFLVGGDGMTGYNTYGSEVIGLRGYDNYALTPYVNSHYAGNVYDKFTVELRYPIIMQSQSTIYGLAFLEGGNCWSDIKNFNPFEIKRSAGVGLRVYLPMVGLLGIDWGWGFDNTGTDSKSHFHFLIGQQF